MVERVALATCSSEPCICKNRAHFTGMPCLARGVAAIRVMREPTEAMVSVGSGCFQSCCYGHEPDDVTARHHAMIDEALK